MTQEEYINAVTELYDGLSEKQKIITGRPKLYRKPLQKAQPKVRPGRKKRRRR